MADASNVRAHLIDWSDRIFTTSIREVFQTLVAAAPEKTGATKKALKYTPLSSSPPFAALIELPDGPDGPYGGEYVETGTVEHDITGHPLLVFEWKGETVFFAKVHKKAQAAKPWFHSTLLAEWPLALADAATTAN